MLYCGISHCCSTEIMSYIIRFFTITFAITLSCSLFAAEKIRVYAAASMTNVVSEVIQRYKQSTGNEVVAIYAGSSSLARQIEKGAPADIYISANSKWVDYLISKNLVKNNRSEVIAHNQLVLVTPTSMAQSPFSLADGAAWRELLANDRLAVGQVESVPAGIYAKQALSHLEVWDDVKDRTAPTNSVRVALALVERAEAVVGIVYKTDALISKKVDILSTFPADSHTPIEYPMVILSDSSQAAEFASFITTDEAKEIFNHYGFN